MIYKRKKHENNKLIHLNNNIDVTTYVKSHKNNVDSGDFILIHEDTNTICIGDVSNHGDISSMISYILYVFIENMLNNEKKMSISTLYKRVNSFLVDLNNNQEHMRTCTLLITRFSSQRHFTFCGMHENIYKINMDGVNLIHTNEHGNLLGITNDIATKEGSINLNKNDHIFLYTDGIMETGDSMETFNDAEKIMKQYTGAIFSNLDVDLKTIHSILIKTIEYSRMSVYNTYIDDVAFALIKKT